MKKKLQVFVSSTYEDMKEERQEAVEAILAAGHIPAGMELFASENAKQWVVIQRWIRESDVFLILLGGRYGSIEPSSDKSYIHREFEYAVSQKKPIMSVRITEGFLKEKVNNGIYSATLPLQTNDERYKALKKALQEKISAEYSNISEVSLAISRMFANNPEQFSKCSGWVSGRNFKSSEKKIIEQYSGVCKASIGLNRDEEFRLLRDSAKKEIFIIGAGMSKLSRLAQNSLMNQLERVPIHLYMLDPQYLEDHEEQANIIEAFFDIPDFKEYVRLSYNTLKRFCEAHNNNSKSKNRITLSTYTTLPTMSMVVIDPYSKNAQMFVEYFTFRCGEERPLFLVKDQKNTQMFKSLFSHANKLFAASCEVVK